MKLLYHRPPEIASGLYQYCSMPGRRRLIAAPTGAVRIVGVDVLIDPSAKRPDGRRAARRSAPTGAVELCRGRCPHRPVPRSGLVPAGGCGRPPLQVQFPGVDVGAHCICAREGSSDVDTASGGYIIRPYGCGAFGGRMLASAPTGSRVLGAAGRRLSSMMLRKKPLPGWAMSLS